MQPSAPMGLVVKHEQSCLAGLLVYTERQSEDTEESGLMNTCSCAWKKPTQSILSNPLLARVFGHKPYP